MLRHYFDVARLFFFNAPAPTVVYTLSLHDALPIWMAPTWPYWENVSGEPFSVEMSVASSSMAGSYAAMSARTWAARSRSEEHTSEFQSRRELVCRLLLDKKNTLYAVPCEA